MGFDLFSKRVLGRAPGCSRCLFSAPCSLSGAVAFQGRSPRYESVSCRGASHCRGSRRSCRCLRFRHRVFCHRCMFWTSFDEQAPASLDPGRPKDHDRILRVGADPIFRLCPQAFSFSFAMVLGFFWVASRCPSMAPDARGHQMAPISKN